MRHVVHDHRNADRPGDRLVVVEHAAFAGGLEKGRHDHDGGDAAVLCHPRPDDAVGRAQRRGLRDRRQAAIDVPGAFADEKGALVVPQVGVFAGSRAQHKAMQTRLDHVVDMGPVAPLVDRLAVVLERCAHGSEDAAQLGHVLFSPSPEQQVCRSRAMIVRARGINKKRIVGRPGCVQRVLQKGMKFEKVMACR